MQDQSGESLEISYVNNADDLIAFHEYHAKNLQPPGEIRLYGITGLLFLAIPALILIGLLWTGLESGEYYDLAFKLLLLALLVYVVVFSVCSKRFQIWQIRRNAQRARSQRGLLCPQQITLTPKAVLHRAEHCESSTQWPAIEHVGSTSTHVFISISPTQAYVVPRRAFASEDAFKVFAQRAKEYRERAALQKALPREGSDWSETGKSFNRSGVKNQVQATEPGKPSQHITEQQ